jgi:hypothetical protein
LLSMQAMVNPAVRCASGSLILSLSLSLTDCEPQIVFEWYYRAPPVVFGRVFAAHSDWSEQSTFKPFAVRFEYAEAADIVD